MTSANRFRLESGPFLMEVTGVASGWIARLDGAGEHYKSTFSDEAAAKRLASKRHEASCTEKI